MKPVARVGLHPTKSNKPIIYIVYHIQYTYALSTEFVLHIIYLVYTISDLTIRYDQSERTENVYYRCVHFIH